MSVNECRVPSGLSFVERATISCASSTVRGLWMTDAANS
jgi:hypothetical protein